MREDSKVEEFDLVREEVTVIDELIDEAQELLNWTSPSEFIVSNLYVKN